MKLRTLVGEECASDTCPRVYQTDRETFVVQGFKLKQSEASQVKLAPTETLVEVPKSLLRALVTVLGAER
jgi:hypothetical protein